MNKLAPSLMVISLAFAGCIADVKPEIEDDAPEDGKADSFRNPTEHGDLAFAVDVNARLGDGARFHSWVFALEGDASLDLVVDSRDENLDTVMYLYRRESEDARWGRYIRRNDDDGERLQSAIRGELDAGLYRVIVKGYKVRHRGPFTVRATCAGDGCDRPEPPNSVTVPDATGFTHSCVDRLWTSMGSPLVSADAFSVSPTVTTGFDHEVLVAIAHYADLSDWREYADEPDEFTFDIEIARMEDGTVVTMADGGDESTTEYAFDQSGDLLAYYVHNQSPWTEFYCGLPGDETVIEPHEDCLSAWMGNGPHDQDEEHEIALNYDPERANDEVNTLMRAAIRQYEATELDGAALPIRVEYVGWEGHAAGNAAEILLFADGYPMVSYTVVEPGWGDPWVVFTSSENNDEGMQMECVR